MKQCPYCGERYDTSAHLCTGESKKTTERERQARDIAEWAVDHKLRPVIDRCTEMIVEAMNDAEKLGILKAAAKINRIGETDPITHHCSCGEVYPCGSEKVLEELILKEAEK